MDKLRESKLEVLEEFIKHLASEPNVSVYRWADVYAEQMLGQLEELEIEEAEAWHEVAENEVPI